MRGTPPGLVKIPMPELIGTRNNRCSHRAVFVRPLGPSQTCLRIYPQCKAHWEYNASRNAASPEAMRHRGCLRSENAV